MTLPRAATAVVVVALGVATAYLVRANRHLEAALAGASAKECRPASPEPPAVDRERPRLRSPIRASGSGMADGGSGSEAAEPSAQEGGSAPLNAADQSRETQIRALLARGDQETVDEYRERVVPVVQAILQRPREELASRRVALEQEADVTAEQHAALDAALDDARQEAILFANQVIQTGQLTAESRNWSGLLSFGGGLGAILDSAQARIDGVLTPAQQQVFTGARFDWAEYLGVSTPWETLEPPPAASALAE